MARPVLAGHRRTRLWDSRSNFSVKHSDEERVYREYTTDERRSRSGCFTEKGRVRCVKEFSDGLLMFGVLAGMACSPEPDSSSPVIHTKPALADTDLPAVFSSTVAKYGTLRRPSNAKRFGIHKARGRSFAYAAPLNSRAQLQAWRAPAEAGLLEVLKIRRSTAAHDRAVQVGASEMIGDIVRTPIQYRLNDGFLLSAFFYRSRELKGRLPTVLLFHGHHSDGKASAAVQGRELSYGEFSGAFDLAQAGFAVFTPDIRTFGESGNRKSHEHLTKVLLLDGQVAVGTYVEDAWAAVDVLFLSPLVDKTRIAVAGLSLGGELALYTHATDSRLKASIVQGYLASHHGTHMRRWHCICQYIPSMGRQFDISDIATVGAPKPILFVVGRKDTEFPVREAKAAFARVSKAYALLGTPDAAELFVHDGAHEWKSHRTIEFLRHHLR